LHGGSRAAGRPHRDRRPRAGRGGRPAGGAVRLRRAAAVPRRAGPGHRRPAGRAAGREPGQGIARRALHGRGPGRRRPAAGRRGHRVVRRARHPGPEPADREPHPGGCLPRADRTGAAIMTTVPEPAAERAGPARAVAGRWPAPEPGAAPLPRMVAAQAGLELRMLLRNGEQLLLTLIIPVLLLLAFGHEPLVTIAGSRINFVVPGILALAVLSTAFTSQAIA